VRARLAVAFVGSAIVIGLLAVTVFPTRIWLRQRNDIAEAQRRAHVLEHTNAALKKRVVDLKSDAAIERIAREQHNLVKPGEQAFAVLPPAADAPAAPKPKVPEATTAANRSFLARLRDRLSFWD
jgi:hypothetical protein